MSIIKSAPSSLIKKGFSFTITVNSTLDIIPDHGAFAVYVYLAGKPEGWVIRPKDIMNRFGKGNDWVRKRMTILKSLKLLRTISHRDELGKIIRWDTELHETPYEPAKAASHLGSTQKGENPQCGKTHLVDKPAHSNTRLLEKQKRKKNNSSLSSLKDLSKNNNTPGLSDEPEGERIVSSFSEEEREEAVKSSERNFADEKERLLAASRDYAISSSITEARTDAELLRQYECNYNASVNKGLSHQSAIFGLLKLIGRGFKAPKNYVRPPPQPKLFIADAPREDDSERSKGIPQSIREQLAAMLPSLPSGFAEAR